MRVFATQIRTLLHIQLLLTCLAIHQKQRIHARDHRDGRAVFRIHFHCVNELSPRMRPAAHMDQTGSAHLIVSLVAVSL